MAPVMVYTTPKKLTRAQILKFKKLISGPMMPLIIEEEVTFQRYTVGVDYSRVELDRFRIFGKDYAKAEADLP